jgi:hypothetical protein
VVAAGKSNRGRRVIVDIDNGKDIDKDMDGTHIVAVAAVGDEIMLKMLEPTCIMTILSFNRTLV